MVRPTSRLLKNGFILVIKKMVAFSTIAVEVLISSAYATAFLEYAFSF